ncbi:MAG: anti-sigma factor antagonist [Verrucomicrobiota bacterium]|jgi:anti-anti-sigma regulatory factor
MGASPANIAVWVNDRFVCVKIAGRAGCACSVDFRSLILGLRTRGWRHFILDLTECQLMDSTFLGVLAWLGLRFSEEAGPLPATIELLNPSDRVSGLLENLGVAQLFQVSRGAPIATDALEPLPQTTLEANRSEIQRTSLEAHQLLIHVDPKNGAKFKDVCKFLEEDLKKMERKDDAPAS